MRALRPLSLALSAASLLALSTRGRAQDAVDDAISLMLIEMSLEEKVGQMTQLTLGALSSGEATPENPEAHQLDDEKLRHAIVEKHIGSILNVHNMAFTGKHWQEILTRIQDLATKETKHKIPILYGIDSVHGANYILEATLFPHNLGLAATRNPELVELCHQVCARETRAAGIPWNFGPVLDVGRQPLWSRFFETYGEDVHITNVLGAASVRGLQGDQISAPHQVAATAKHFLAYSYPLSGRDRTQSLLPERYLREHFLPPFMSAVKEDVRAVMVNSSEVNGLPVHSNHSVLTKLLRGQMQFKGVVVSDWEDVKKLHELHRVAPNLKEAVRLSVEAGIDICMAPYDFQFTDHLVELVKEGLILEELIDESVARILRLKFDLGLFNNPYPDPALLADIGSEQAAAISRQAAQESLVLLKNEGVLPIARDAKILLTGPGCNSLAALHGSWSYTWQGTDEAAYPQELQTVLEAFNEGHGRDNVLYAPGVRWDRRADYERAVRSAQNAYVIVCVLAEQPSTETPGNIENLALPAKQRRLIRELAIGKPLVLVLLENRPRLITDVVGHCHAIVYAGYPGPQGGAALYDLLSGAINPSGKLPFTYPRDPNNILPYDHKLSDTAGNKDGEGGFNPLYEFAHGLSYTTFKYDKLNVPPIPLTQVDSLSLSVEVTNTGPRKGAETVHVFVRDLFASVVPPVKRLRAFKKVTIEPGTTETVTFDIPVTDLAFFGPRNYPIVEPGEFEVMVGDQKATIVVE
jgi:beta-glucosidase